MLDFFISPAFAEATAQKPNAMMSFMPFILIFAVFYFLMIRPQKKKLEEEKNLLAKLGKGDEVYTKSGVLGVIQGLTDKVITLEVSDGVKMKVLRGHIAGFSAPLFETKESKGK
ncbi:MAG: preprotein translocase subunit YajC [Epsilonproteobacteria bacterium]|nr:MAG: preprotein translocase subunit YajC [Campylobacterota bacterium]RLA68046.1 MAG: preprotein translocase subunit YajC [Campylobacterota bacterium]